MNDSPPAFPLPKSGSHCSFYAFGLFFLKLHIDAIMFFALSISDLFSLDGCPVGPLWQDVQS